MTLRNKAPHEPPPLTFGERLQRNQREVLLAVVLTIAAAAVLTGYLAF